MLIVARDASAEIGADSAGSPMCHCPACAGIRVHTDGEGGDPANPHYFLDPTDGTAPPPNNLEIFNWDEAAAHLNRTGSGWVDTLGTAITVTYAFRDTAPFTMPNGTSGFSQFNADQIFAAEAALELWSDVANITFTRVNPAGYSNSASILFGNYSAGAEGAAAFAYLPDGPGREAAGNLSGDIWVNITLADNIDPSVFGEYGMHTLAHEIGHAIGFSHPGDYNASEGDPTYPEDSDYWQDSRAYTIMSYFGSGGVGHALGAFAAGPQLHDIAAAQRLYGVNMTTRTGDTIYGYNSNTDREHLTVTSGTDRPVFAVWDAGGNDTFDFSIYSTNSEIDLREQAFSSVGTDTGGVGLAIGNISIARGAVIENAIGGGGADTIIGNAVANLLNGNAGADNITGNEGNDTLIGGEGADALNGGIGSDTASYDTAFAAVTVDMTAMGTNTGDAAGDTFTSIENITGSFWSDTLRGNATANIILGGQGSDIIAGGLGNDTIDGGIHNDTINYTFGDGIDTIDGGADFDLFAILGNANDSILRATLLGGVLTVAIDCTLANIESVTANMLGGVDWLIYTTTDAVTANLGLGTATGFTSLLNVENIITGTGIDTLTGSSANNKLDSGDGADILHGMEGNDEIVAGGGDDWLYGGTGNDILRGQGGIDYVSYTEETDSFFATFNGQANVRRGSAGAAIEDLLDGVDHFVGGAGNDTVLGNSIANVFYGYTGNDTLNGGGGNDVLNGEGGDDILIGAGAADTIYGGAGNDTINYTIGDGADSVDGGNDTDTLAITGTNSDNVLNVVYNGSVLTHFFGNSATTVEIFTANMQAGVDWLTYNTSSAVSVNLNAGTASGFTSVTSVENAIGGTNNDALTGSSVANTLDGGDGADTITGLAGNDTLRGGLGVDTINGGIGADSIDGGAGNDVIAYVFGDGADSINGGADADTLNLTGSGVENVLRATYNGASLTGVLDATVLNVETINLDGGGGVDWLTYSASATVNVNLGAGTATGFASITSIENAVGGAGNDSITGSTGANTLDGGDGGDTIVGLAGTDALRGQSGNDTLTGGADNDTLTGGLGADTFVYAAGAGSDTITDFDADVTGGQDLIDVTGFGITSGDFGARVVITDMGAFTAVTIDGSVSITLSTVTGDGANVLTVNDFLLS